MTDKRAPSPLLFYGAGIVVVAAVAAVVLVLPAEFRTYTWLRLVLLLLAILAGLVFASEGWRRTTDEVAREAHKFASLWGSHFGLLLGLAALAVGAVLLVPHHLMAQTTAALVGGGVSSENIVWMLGGAMFVCLASVAGYLLAWGAWWLRRR